MPMIPVDGPVDPAALAARLNSVRQRSVALAAPLSEADCQVQSMPDASPIKWHLAHTTWFFETFVLERHESGFRPHDPTFRVLFNSYYQGVGPQHPRPQRGLITRPGLADVLAWRAAVDERIATLLARGLDDAALALVELGLQHEQQHQELMLTDVQHALSRNPLMPSYGAPPRGAAAGAAPLGWLASEGGLVEIGHGGRGFAFDNEGPRHRVWLCPHALADRLVTQGDWAAFITEGGYDDPRWWLAAGWDWLRAHAVGAPLYWQREPGTAWQRFGLDGLHPIEPAAPVAHVSYFEADAFARWWGAAHGLPTRLPTEAEWEHGAAPFEAEGRDHGNLAEAGLLRPCAGSAAHQFFGDVWEWTSSSYAAYPGFRAWDGAVGEYNGKFMVNQYVLRGGSCATPRSHIRASYRNFFPTEARWQFSGLRLARDLD